MCQTQGAESKSGRPFRSGPHTADEAQAQAGEFIPPDELPRTSKDLLQPPRPTGRGCPRLVNNQCHELG